MQMRMGMGLTKKNPLFSRYEPLSSIVNGVVQDIDATLIDSYDGSSQSWSNLVPSPADGETQAAYDHFLGASGTPSTDDPTFVGTAGSQLAYFSFDGGDRTRIQSGNTTLLDSIHRTDETSLEFTFAISIYWPSAITTGQSYLCGTNNANADNGFQIRFDRGVGDIRFRQQGGGTSQDTVITGVTLNDDDWNLIVFSLQKTSGTGGNYKFRLNGDTIQTGTLTTFGASLVDATDDYQISGVSGSLLFPNGVRVSAASMFNTFLSDNDFQSVRSQYSLRTGNTYI